MSLTEERFNKIFSTSLVVGMAIAVLGTTIFKYSAAEGGRTLILVSAFSSMMGILSSVLSANGRISTFFFGLLDVSIYGALCFISHRYGNAFLHFLYFVPMQFVGFWGWKKRGAKANVRPQARRLDSRGWALCTTFALLAGTAAYFALIPFDTETEGLWKVAVLLDVIPLVCNILGQYLMSTAYMEQWIFWLLVNIFSIAMWSHTLHNSADGGFASVYIVKYAFYLLNSANGLRIWIKMSAPVTKDKLTDHES